MPGGGEPGDPSPRERWLNGATAVVLVLAAALFVRDRVLPAWRARQVVEIGERAPESLSLVTLATGDTVRLGRLRPSLLLWFQSTCPACGRNLPAWRRLVAERPPEVRVAAVGLEDAVPALAYVREELPEALAVRTGDRARATRIMGVEAVPTTQLVGADGRLLWSRSGVLTAADVDRVLRRARGDLASGSDPEREVPSESPSGRRP